MPYQAQSTWVHSAKSHKTQDLDARLDYRLGIGRQLAKSNKSPWVTLAAIVRFDACRGKQALPRVMSSSPCPLMPAGLGLLALNLHTFCIL